MKTIRLRWLLIICVLVLLGVDVGWRVYTALSIAGGGGEIKRVRVLPIQTNGATGTAIVDASTKQPLWSEWCFAKAGIPDTVSYYFEGKSVMDIHLTPGGLSKRDVVFYSKDGQPTVLWADRGGLGFFTDRILYDGERRTYQIWCNDGWHGIENRGRSRGIMLNGQWREVEFTNGIWKAITQAGNMANAVKEEGRASTINKSEHE